MTQAKSKKTVFVLVHGDIWGALNANQLMPELAKRNCEIRLIVSRSTPDSADGKPANKNLPQLRPFLALKENALQRFFEFIDITARFTGLDDVTAKYATFKTLALKYCGDAAVHYTTHGGPKGGTQIQVIFDDLATKGIKPDLVLSGDTLAILPASIVDHYSCFGTHPGPLPDIPGMHGTERSVMHHRFFNEDGSPHNGYSLPYVKGSLFKLAPTLDRGPVIAFATAPYVNGMTLMDLRAGLYHELIAQMIEHLDVFLDSTKREVLVKQRTDNPINKTRTGLPGLLPEVEDLKPDTLSFWTNDGIMFGNDDGTMTVQYNMIFDPDQMKSWMHCFWPEKWPKDIFEHTFYSAFQGNDVPIAPPSGLMAQSTLTPRKKIVVPGTHEFSRAIREIGSRFM